MTEEKFSPYPEEQAIAKVNPNGWVYRLAKNYSTTDYVPPESIVGAWKVDADGNIIGDFIRNPNFIAEKCDSQSA